MVRSCGYGEAAGRRILGKDAVAMRCCWLVVPLVCCLLAGCLATAPDQRPSAWTSRLRPPLPPDVVIIDFTLLERPLGDPFLNKELWTHTDELLVDLEKQAALEENGWRIGQLVGMTPADLQALLKSERWCVNRHRQRASAGKTYLEYLSPAVLPHCDYDVVLGGQRHELQVDRARFCLDVVPALAADGKTKLTFTPRVETGEQVLPFQPVPDQSTWTFKIERPGKAYKDLSWHAVLAPNEYLVIGPRLDKPDTLGYAALVQGDGLHPVQRLLVIRTTRSLQTGAGDQPTREEATSTSPPLAVQATMGVIRASRP